MSTQSDTILKFPFTMKASNVSFCQLTMLSKLRWCVFCLLIKWLDVFLISVLCACFAEKLETFNGETWEVNVTQFFFLIDFAMRKFSFPHRLEKTNRKSVDKVLIFLYFFICWHSIKENNKHMNIMWTLLFFLKTNASISITKDFWAN